MNKLLIEAAETYKDAGFNPLPVKANKHPLADESGQVPWHNVEIDDIPQRFSRAEKIGICCGRISSFLYCMDFDCHKGQDIASVFRDFTQTEIYKWLISHNAVSVYVTPSGGYHIWFQAEYDMAGSTYAKWEDGKEVMIELRGTGQYAICAPTEGYRFITGCELQSITPLHDGIVHSLLAAARLFDRSGTPINEQVSSGNKWPDKWNTGTPDGKYNEECADEALQLLVKNGWQILTQRKSDGAFILSRPGKDPKEGGSATWGARRHMFWNFSSSSDQFPPNRSYNPFQIYTILEHGGNWREAKDALRARFQMRTIQEMLAEKPDIVDDFPVDVFPPEMQVVMYEYNKAHRFSFDYMALAMCTVVSAVVGNKYKLQVKYGYNAPLIFWGAAVGTPGANKSHPVDNMVAPLESIDKKYRAEYAASMEAWEMLDEKEQKKAKKPGLKKLVVKDTTVEALIDTLTRNPRGVLHHKDELLAFFNDMHRRPNSSDRQFWLSSVNNSSYSVDRVSTGHKHIDAIHINIIGTIQHDPLYNVLLNASEDGLIQRFLFTKSMDKAFALTDDPLDPRVVDTWTDMLHTLHDHCKYESAEDTILLPLSGETFKAAQKYDEQLVYKINSKEQTAIVESYLAKMRTYLHRFALLMCVFDAISTGEEVAITADHYERAYKVTNYFLQTFADLVGAKDELQEIKRIISTMKSKSNKEIIISLAADGHKQVNIAKALGITKQAVYKVLKST